MIPYRIVGKTTYRPYATFAILTLCGGFFIWAIQVSVQAATPFATLLPQYTLSTCDFGHKDLLGFLGDGVRALFLHTSFMEFVTNMLFLWIFAPRVEEFMGHRRFFVLFLLMGFGGHFASFLFGGGDCVILASPSGAISGVLAAFLFLYPAKRIDTGVPFTGRSFELPAVFFVVMYLGIQFFADSGGPLSGDIQPYWDEIGGFAMGLAIIFIGTLFKPAPNVDAFDFLDK